jgi:hypothetical protein
MGFFEVQYRTTQTFPFWGGLTRTEGLHGTPQKNVLQAKCIEIYIIMFILVEMTNIVSFPLKPKELLVLRKFQWHQKERER